MTDDDVPFVWGVEDKYRHSQTKRLILFIKLKAVVCVNQVLVNKLANNCVSDRFFI